MQISRTIDKEVINSVLCHSDIFPLISEGADVTPEDFTPPMRLALYLQGEKDGLVGIAAFHSFWDGLKFHPNVLPNKRKHTNEFIRGCLAKVKHPVYIEIPERLERLAAYHGFSEICRDQKILMRLLK